MSWHGRGRGFGRGYYGGFHRGRRPENQKPFILYPDDDIVLPNLPNNLFEKDSKKQEVLQQIFLVRKGINFRDFFQNSPYYLRVNSGGENAIEKAFQNERYSDRLRLKSSKKRPLSDYQLELKKNNFPRELLVGMKRRGQKKVKWDFKREDKMFKDWEKNEAKRGDFEENNDSDDEEKDEEEEEEKKMKGEEESEEDDNYDSDGNESPVSSDGDYGVGERFDDDEDDYNPTDDDFDDEGPVY